MALTLFPAETRPNYPRRRFRWIAYKVSSREKLMQFYLKRYQECSAIAAPLMIIVLIQQPLLWGLKLSPRRWAQLLQKTQGAAFLHFRQVSRAERFHPALTASIEAVKRRRETNFPLLSGFHDRKQTLWFHGLQETHFHIHFPKASWRKYVEDIHIIVTYYYYFFRKGVSFLFRHIPRYRVYFVISGAAIRRSIKHYVDISTKFLNIWACQAVRLLCLLAAHADTVRNFMPSFCCAFPKQNKNRFMLT